jgi:integrase
MQDKKRNHRPHGSIYTRPDSPYIYIAYSAAGRKVRENTHLTNQKAARKLLDSRLGAVANGDSLPCDISKTTLGELLEMVRTDYRINGKKSLKAIGHRVRLHLAPFFYVVLDQDGKFTGGMRAVQVSSTHINNYINARQQAGASNASVNRELAILKRGYKLGMQTTPTKVLKVPRIPHLKETNIRKGFVESAKRDCLAVECAKVGLWLRTMFELGMLCGWRRAELVNLRVNQVDLMGRTIRLNVGETKNDAGRLAAMTGAAYTLVAECVHGKSPDDYVFTRPNGKRVRDFRGGWRAACCAVGLGRMVCPRCVDDNGLAFTVDSENHCPHCLVQWRKKDLKYKGLIFHDLRRSAVRNMVRSGTSEAVAMKISGHKTRSVFDRYNIVSEEDLRDAARRQEPSGTELSPVSVTALPSLNSKTVN